MTARWLATITYRTELGSQPVDHALHEISDLDKLVERGPHWDTIEKIEIVRVNHCTDKTLTVEKAETL